jgi:hypothetical protein
MASDISRSSDGRTSPKVRRGLAQQSLPWLSILAVRGDADCSTFKLGRGRPTVPVNVPQIARLRSEGLSWAAIGKKLGIGESTARTSRRIYLPVGLTRRARHTNTV